MGTVKLQDARANSGKAEHMEGRTRQITELFFGREVGFLLPALAYLKYTSISKPVTDSKFKPATLILPL